MLPLVTQAKSSPIALFALRSDQIDAWLATQSAKTQAWAVANQLSTPGNSMLMADEHGILSEVVVHIDSDKYQPQAWMAYAGVVASLPPGCYQWAKLPEAESCLAALAFGLACYQFTRYKTSKKTWPTLLVSDACYQEIAPQLRAIYLTRDLINTPTEDLGPLELADAAKTLADTHQANFKQWQGSELQESFPTIHAVGRASAKPPCLIEFQWGNTQHPKLTLIGKGVCFDSGGLDIKPASGMLTMKKDMGGAAHVLGLAQMIMHHQLPVSLHVLIPAVENAISSNAYRPGDVLRSRSGRTIEINNTDAEGRVILADAITYATERSPDLIIDFATLTGAARVAVGTEFPAVFTQPSRLGFDLMELGEAIQDPLWPLPLYQGYRDLNQSSIADISNSSNGAYAGAITAALFLQSFVGQEQPWIHLDLMAWNLKSKPGKPEGGEAMGLRSMYAFLQTWATIKDTAE
jgi:leucyl aminopeptidase